MTRRSRAKAVRRGWSTAALGVLALSCTAPAPRDDALQVAVSVPPQAYFVDRIAGGRVAVQVLVPPGSSPATYEATPRQMLALGRSRLYVAVGHPDFPFERRHLSGFLARHEALEVVDMAAGVPWLDEAGHGHGESDPHVWLSPGVVRIAAETIARALVRVDPDGRDVYESNLDVFAGEVEALDAEIAAIFDGLTRRGFLVQHPAWGYFAQRYGLEQMAIESGGKEPSPATLARLVERARREGVAVVFVQPGFADRSARVVAGEIGARVVTVDPLAYDWPANLRQVAAAFREALGDG